ncbi:YkgG family uncharacterized protein [Orenia metallireducens]|jgi:hypothetical protein|uniref:Uncharacterized ACR, YkgG family COG1556 n=1 Tax=Orenia metallireducens TaxID=1413210 RepID=A0A285F1T7_9FIRM|nr:lactate utilization protein [Orenia metallireducens]PRX34704.1 YkgG family uncharacterized protein [Orenia metallireducens]SNY05255.1 Uncharacterised ACR, YkgG family COG1556 [Orenia metallireducens]
MDENIKWYHDLQIRRLLDNISDNNMQGFYVKTRKELLTKVNELIPKGSVVGVGDSMTLFETGIIDLLRQKDYIFLDKYQENLTRTEKDQLYSDVFSADSFLCSTNAITEEGELYNIDGYGNRVAAMIFGPKQVIIVAGKNKIVKDLEEAKNRVKNIAAPIDAKRLNKNTPCTKVGYCVDCNSKDRICNNITIIKKQLKKDRIKIIIVDENLGY